MAEKKVSAGNLESFKFYWMPPRGYYDRGELEFFGKEYGFIVQKSYGLRTGIVISGNSNEPADEFDVDSIVSENELSYFFEIDQSKIPSNMLQRVIRAFFEDKIYIKGYLEDL